MPAFKGLGLGDPFGGAASRAGCSGRSTRRSPDPHGRLPFRLDCTAHVAIGEPIGRTGSHSREQPPISFHGAARVR